MYLDKNLLKQHGFTLNTDKDGNVTIYAEHREPIPGLDTAFEHLIAQGLSEIRCSIILDEMAINVNKELLFKLIQA